MTSGIPPTAAMTEGFPSDIASNNAFGKESERENAPCCLDQDKLRSGILKNLSMSAGEEVARFARGAKVVKAFNTIGAANFENPRFGSENASMFICGDDSDAKMVAAKLASELNFDVVDVGAPVEARWLEALAMLWIHLAYQQGFGATGLGFKLLRR